MWGLKSSSHRYDEETDDESPYAVSSVEEEPAITRLANANGESRSAPAPIPPLPPLLPAPSPPRDSSESEEDSESDLEADQILRRNKKRKRKAGRKSTWSLIDLSELTDVICSSERYKRNIICLTQVVI